jgi:hypothetical protein
MKNLPLSLQNFDELIAKDRLGRDDALSDQPRLHRGFYLNKKPLL